MKEDWIECDAKFLGKLIRGINYKKTQSSDKPEDGYLPIFRGNNILDNQLNFENLKYVQKDLIKTEQKILEDDIIFAMSSGSKHLVGKSAQAKKDFEGSFGAFCAVFRPNKIISSSFIQAYFHSSTFRRMISNASKGSNINNLKREHILEAIVPLPPLIEQKAIVNKIEELFSSLDSGIADLEKAQEQLKIYRQAVLKKAFDGDLTKEWRKQQKTNKKWENVPLKKVLIQSKEKHKPDKIEKIFYVGLEHIEKETGDLTETVGKEEIRTVKNKFQKGQILYGKLRPYLNKVYLAKQCGVCSTDILVFTPTDKINNKYALLFMLSREFVNDMSNNTNGVNLPRVSTKFVNEYNISLPSIKEQSQIVQEIESRLSVCDKVEKDIANSLEKAQALRQSILKKAFEGKLLTEEEIAQCKAHPDYEPASVLLEKIRLEKKKK